MALQSLSTPLNIPNGRLVNILGNIPENAPQMVLRAIYGIKVNICRSTLLDKRSNKPSLYKKEIE